MRFHFFLLSGFLHQAVVSFDCNNGCDLEPNANGPPVCGENGQSYMNRCLAVCQGIQVARNGVCPGDPPMDMAPYRRSGMVPIDKITRFQSEHFQMISRRNFVQSSDIDPDDVSGNPMFSSDQNIGSGAAGQNNGNQGRKGAGPNGNPGGNGQGKFRRRGIVRIDSEGYEYYADVVSDPEAPSNEHDMLPPGLAFSLDGEVQSATNGSNATDGGSRTRRLGGKNNARTLALIGNTDDRTQITNTQDYPYRTIGELDNPNCGVCRCTATVISRTSALTAGHCIHSNGAWTGLNRLAPGRYSHCDGGGCSTREPYGEWWSDYMTTYTQWTDDADREYDFAVITFHSQNGNFIGDTVGYMGFSSTSNSGSDLQQATVTGYPYDKKPDGQMWTSGSCAGSYRAGWDPKLTYHDCDAVGANSGSALLDIGSGRVYGVHVAGLYHNRAVSDWGFYNVGVVLDSEHYSNLENWSGRGRVGVIRVEENMQCMDMDSSNNVYIYNCHGKNNQNWYWDRNTLQIKSSANNNCLDYHYGNGNLYVGNCHGGDNQKWDWDGSRLVTRYDGKCVDMHLSDGSQNLYLHSCHNGANQKFIVTDRFFGQGVIRVEYNQQCMDMSSSNNVYIHTCHGNSNQKWYWDSTTLQIKSFANGKCLDYHYGNGNLYVGNCHGGDNQKWDWDGSRLITRYDGKCVDMHLSDGSQNLYLHSCHNGSNQKFGVPSDFFS